MPANLTSDALWDALYRIGSEDGTADKIAPEVIGKLIEFKLVELTAVGLPQLTSYREQAFSAMESGDGADYFPELGSPGRYA